jgi:uncharacterized protein
MSRRDGFGPGVPCWVDVLGPDPRQLTGFYGALFGWEFEGPGAMPGGGEYFVARLRGREVAGVGSLPAGVEAPAWDTYVQVESADRAAEDVLAAGGTVLAEPVDAAPAGRLAVVADPEGAAFCLWEPHERRGAQLVNEPGAWSMSALNVRDREGAAAFYGAAFGWQADSFRAGEMEVGLFRLPGFVGGEPEQPVPRDVVAALAPLTDPAARAHWSVDFWIDDLAHVTSTATELGGGVLVAPHDVPPLRRAVVADPNGVAFGVSELDLPA